MNLTDDIPAPWRITYTGSAFKIGNARGRSVAWVYCWRKDALKAEYLSQDQAREMAKAIARLSR